MTGLMIRQLELATICSYTSYAGISYSFLTEFDSDEDGVVDSKDMCPIHRQELKLMKMVVHLIQIKMVSPDYLDDCTGTPNGAPVDKNGCPLDSDKDGSS